jgi:hypothetical protein
MEHSLYRKRVVDEIIEQYLQVFGQSVLRAPSGVEKLGQRRNTQRVFFM